MGVDWCEKLIFAGLGIREEGCGLRAAWWRRWKRDVVVVVDVSFLKGTGKLAVEEAVNEEDLAFGREERWK